MPINPQDTWETMNSGLRQQLWILVVDRDSAYTRHIEQGNSPETFKDEATWVSVYRELIAQVKGLETETDKQLLYAYIQTQVATRIVEQQQQEIRHQDEASATLTPTRERLDSLAVARKQKAVTGQRGQEVQGILADLLAHTQEQNIPLPPPPSPVEEDVKHEITFTEEQLATFKEIVLSAFQQAYDATKETSRTYQLTPTASPLTPRKSGEAASVKTKTKTVGNLVTAPTLTGDQNGILIAEQIVTSKHFFSSKTTGSPASSPQATPELERKAQAKLNKHKEGTAQAQSIIAREAHRLLQTELSTHAQTLGITTDDFSTIIFPIQHNPRSCFACGTFKTVEAQQKVEAARGEHEQHDQAALLASLLTHHSTASRKGQQQGGPGGPDSP